MNEDFSGHFSLDYDILKSTVAQIVKFLYKIIDNMSETVNKNQDMTYHYKRYLQI